MLVAIELPIKYPLDAAVGDQLETVPAGRGGHVNIGPVDGNAVFGRLDDCIGLGMDRGYAVVVFHHVSHVVAMRHAAHAAIIAC